MASPTLWTWVWASSRSWWWTGKPGMLQSMGSQSWTWLSDWTNLPLASQLAVVKKILPVNAGDKGLILGWGWSPGGGNGKPLQYSWLGNLMDRGARRATVHGVAKSCTRPHTEQFASRLSSLGGWSVAGQSPRGRSQLSTYSPVAPAVICPAYWKQEAGLLHGCLPQTQLQVEAQQELWAGRVFSLPVSV